MSYKAVFCASIFGMLIGEMLSGGDNIAGVIASSSMVGIALAMHWWSNK